MLVMGGNSAGDFLKLLGNGKDFGLKRLNYTCAADAFLKQ
jgi:glucose-1-phosphate thymidylyltransferase